MGKFNAFCCRRDKKSRFGYEIRQPGFLEREKQLVNFGVRFLCLRFSAVEIFSLKNRKASTTQYNHNKNELTGCRCDVKLL